MDGETRATLRGRAAAKGQGFQDTAKNLSGVSASAGGISAIEAKRDAFNVSSQLNGLRRELQMSSYLSAFVYKDESTVAVSSKSAVKPESDMEEKRWYTYNLRQTKPSGPKLAIFKVPNGADKIDAADIINFNNDVQGRPPIDGKVTVLKYVPEANLIYTMAAFFNGAVDEDPALAGTTLSASGEMIPEASGKYELKASIRKSKDQQEKLVGRITRNGKDRLTANNFITMNKFNCIDLQNASAELPKINGLAGCESFKSAYDALEVWYLDKAIKNRFDTSGGVMQNKDIDPSNLDNFWVNRDGRFMFKPFLGDADAIRQALGGKEGVEYSTSIPVKHKPNTKAGNPAKNFGYDRIPLAESGAHTLLDTKYSNIVSAIGNLISVSRLQAEVAATAKRRKPGKGRGASKASAMNAEESARAFLAHFKADA